MWLGNIFVYFNMILNQAHIAELYKQILHLLIASLLNYKYFYSFDLYSFSQFTPAGIQSQRPMSSLFWSVCPSSV